MSETVRSFSSGRSFSLNRRRPKRLRWLLLALALCAGVYTFWITRDTVPAERFIAGGQRMHVAIRDFAARRDAWSNSPAWKLLPAGHWLSDVETLISQDIALPEWVLDNLVGRTCLISGSRNADADGIVFVTRMSPVGVLLERVNRFAPGIDRDSAGGLGLLHAHENGIYYAVRGRVLILSPSRRALITALTLAPEERIAPEVLAAAVSEAGDEDVRGSVMLRPEEPLGRFFHTLSFAVRVDESRVQARLQGALRDEWLDQLAPLLPNTSPAALPHMPGGLLQIGANLNTSPKALWPAVGKLFEAFDIQTPLTAEQWRVWNDELPEDATARVLTAMLQPAGGTFALAWNGFEMDTEIPCPLLVGQFPGFTAHRPTPTAEGESEPPASWTLPLTETPSIAWHVAQTPSALAIAMGPTTRDVSQPDTGPPPSQTAHVLVHWLPKASAGAVIEAGRQLQANHMLTAQAETQFDTWAREWNASVAGIREITAAFTHDQGLVDIDFDVACETP